MASDPVTQHATECEDCGLLTSTVFAPTTDPLTVLKRLPPSLFNRNPPSDTGVPGAQWDDVFADQAQFGVIPPTALTLQYELARIFAEEKDAFVKGWRIAKALQLGLGLMAVNDAQQVDGQCPHATGTDLDRVGEQFGVGRPFGFTDCCYWRLILLMLFKPGPTLWRLLEIAELYTGVRPIAVEEPALVRLSWGVATGLRSYWNDSVGWSANMHGIGFWQSDAEVPLPPSTFDGYWTDGGVQNHQTYWNQTRPILPGLLLRQALEIVKSAGVYLVLENAPEDGVGGCFGATFRANPEASVRGRWS